jgi:hypothetical protein
MSCERGSYRALLLPHREVTECEPASVGRSLADGGYSMTVRRKRLESVKLHRLIYVRTGPPYTGCAAPTGESERSVRREAYGGLSVMSNGGGGRDAV